MTSRAYPPSEDLTVILSGDVHRMSVRTRQSGDEVVVFLHGLGCSGESYREAWAFDGLSAYSLVTIDYLGHGLSASPAGFSYSIEDHARSITAILQSYRNQPIHLVGHSLGGAVALHLPAALRASIQSFVNVEGNLTPEDCRYGSRRASNRPYDEFLRDVLPAFKRSSETWRAVGLDLAHPEAFYKTAGSLVRLTDDGSLLDGFHKWKGRKVYVHGEENADHPSVDAVLGGGTPSSKQLNSMGCSIKWKPGNRPS